jgi:hypothetical protein
MWLVFEDSRVSTIVLVFDFEACLWKKKDREKVCADVTSYVPPRKTHLRMQASLFGNNKSIMT